MHVILSAISTQNTTLCPQILTLPRLKKEIKNILLCVIGKHQMPS